MSDTETTTKREALARLLGLEAAAPSAAIYAAVRLALDLAERPTGIDPGEQRSADVQGLAFLFGFVPRRKVLAWEDEGQRIAMGMAEGMLSLQGVDLRKVAAGGSDEIARANEAMEKLGGFEARQAKLLALHLRQLDLHRDIVRWGVCGWALEGAPKPTFEDTAEATTTKRRVLSEGSLDLLEARNLIEPLALAVLRHWRLTGAEKKR